MVGGGIIKGVLGLAILGLALSGWLDTSTARSAMFQFLAVGQLFYAYPSRHTTVVPLPNFALHWAVALGIGIQLLVGTLPGPAALLGLTPLDAATWTLVFAVSLFSWGLAEILNRVLWKR